MGCFPCHYESKKNQKNQQEKIEKNLDDNKNIVDKNLENKLTLEDEKDNKEKLKVIKNLKKLENNKSKGDINEEINDVKNSKTNKNLTNSKEKFLTNDIGPNNPLPISGNVHNPFNKPETKELNNNESNNSIANERKDYIPENNNNKDDKTNITSKISIDNNKNINIDKNNNFNIIDANINNNYEKFNDNKEYFLICPECKKNIINIESMIYQTGKNDFLITYKCFCDERNQKFFYQVISEYFPLCGEHKNKLYFLCKKCNKFLCEKCLDKDEHKKHIIKNIISKKVFSEDIISKINEKRDEFKGISIITKILNFYQSYKNNKIIKKYHHNDNLIEKQETNKVIKIQENTNNNNNILKNNNKNNNIIINNNEMKNNIEAKNNSEKDLSKVKYKNIKTFMGHNDIISVLIILNNGYIASGSYDETVKIWDITKKEKNSLIMKKNATGAVLCLLEFEPGKLLGGTSDNMINLWDLKVKENEEFIYNFYEHFLYVTALVKCDENHFASASNDLRIIIWNYKNRVSENSLNGHTDCIITMILLKCGHLCSAGADEEVRIWDWKQSKCLYCFKPHKKYIKCLLELDNGYLLTASEDNTIGIFEKNNSLEYKNIIYLKGHECPIRTLCQINDNYFASGSFDNKIKIWDLRTKECVQVLEGHQSYVICVIKFKEDILISCSNDKYIKIWKQE